MGDKKIYVGEEGAKELYRRTRENLASAVSDIGIELDKKATTGHTHDDRYYTEAETKTLINSVAEVPVTFTVNPRFVNDVAISSATKVFKSGGLYILTGFDLISKSTNPFNADSSDTWPVNAGTVAIVKVEGLNLSGKNILHLLNGSGTSYNHFVCSLGYIATLDDTFIYVGSGASMIGYDAWYGSANTVLI